MYQNYKKARDVSWKVILDCNIHSLPVNLNNVANHYGIKIVVYSNTSLLPALNDKAMSVDGFSAIIGEQKIIFINGCVGNKHRRRFTLAHELGHCILNHPLDHILFRASEQCIFETEANIFARDLLMPSAVLAAMNVHRFEDIMNICGVSAESAKLRAERLKYLYQKNIFCTHPYEKAVAEQFKEYIEKFKYN